MLVVVCLWDVVLAICWDEVEGGRGRTQIDRGLRGIVG